MSPDVKPELNRRLEYMLTLANTSYEVVRPYGGAFL